jgi:hypothetical protein
MPGWVAPAAFAALVVLVLFLVAYRNTWRMVQRTKARRPNPSRAEFVSLLSRDVRPETAEFLWEQMTYLLPTIAPHPDDHLWNELPIDEEEPMHDWWTEFARQHGVDAEDWPDWPAGSPCTIRNYARWLECGLARRRAEHARP